MDIPDKKQAFVEQAGLYLEGMGLTRIAGRVVGWLLMCDPPYQQQTELVEALGASKSSISVALKELTMLSLVERVSLPGDRRTYYRTAKDMWMRSFQARMHHLNTLKELAEQGLAALEGEPERVQQRLMAMRDMNAFLADEFPRMLDRWDELKKAKGYDDQ
jgi:DNA-binding transcriptional regulator GbsR (MarR family)